MKKLALVCLLFLSGSAYAESLTVTLDSAQTSGGLLTFSGTLENSSGSPVFINSDTIDLDTPLQYSDLFLNGAPFSLNPGQTSDPFEFFAVSIPVGTPVGKYDGTIFVLGGGDGNAQNVVGEEAFSVNVTPEPSSLLLFGPAATALMMFRRKITRTASGGESC
jgi:hypothetical protein